MCADRNFDDMAERFGRTVYQTPRGQLRLRALEADFQTLQSDFAGLKVLDIGGGQGQFSLWLAQQGAHITLCDISEEMIALARRAFASQGLSATIQRCALQDVATQFPETYDIVLNHAVLEWLDDPLAALQTLTRRVAPQGVLSLMFYNRIGHQWRQLMNGRVQAPDSANTRLRKAGNAPQNPLYPEQVLDALKTLDFDIVSWRGIRCIRDHMHEVIRQRIGEDAIAEADLHYGTIDPFRQFGRYIHVLARPAANTMAE